MNTDKKLRVGAVVLAAGKGRRMESKTEKQYLTLAGRPLGSWCMEALEPEVDQIVLVSSPGEEEHCYDLLVRPYGYKKVSRTVAGGKERYDSVYEGLKALENCDIVLIQDSARPCLTKEVIHNCINGVLEHGACVAAVPSKDTVKQVAPEGYAVNTPDRSGIWIIQTPQAFRYDLIKNAYEKMMATDDHSMVTDDAMVVERYTDNKVYMAQGTYENIKVTTPGDLEVAELYLGKINQNR